MIRGRGARPQGSSPQALTTPITFPCSSIQSTCPHLCPHAVYERGVCDHPASSPSPHSPVREACERFPMVVPPLSAVRSWLLADPACRCPAMDAQERTIACCAPPWGGSEVVPRLRVRRNAVDSAPLLDLRTGEIG